VRPFDARVKALDLLQAARRKSKYFFGFSAYYVVGYGVLEATRGAGCKRMCTSTRKAKEIEGKGPEEKNPHPVTKKTHEATGFSPAQRT